VVNLHWGFPPPQHAQETQQTLADRATREDNGEDDSKDDDDDDDGVPPLEQGSSEATSGVLGNCSTVAFVVEHHALIDCNAAILPVGNAQDAKTNLYYNAKYLSKNPV